MGFDAAAPLIEIVELSVRAPIVAFWPARSRIAHWLAVELATRTFVPAGIAPAAPARSVPRTTFVSPPNVLALLRISVPMPFLVTPPAAAERTPSNWTSPPGVVIVRTA